MGFVETQRQEGLTNITINWLSVKVWSFSSQMTEKKAYIYLNTLASLLLVFSEWVLWIFLAKGLVSVAKAGVEKGPD